MTIWETLLLLFGGPALLAGCLIVAAGITHRFRSRRRPPEPAPFFGPDPDRDTREYHGMNRAEWERTPTHIRDQHTAAYKRHLERTRR